MPRTFMTFTAILAATFVTAAVDADVVRKVDGEIRVDTPDVPRQHVNPWPESQEDAYWDRAQPLLAKNVGKIRTDTPGEHEKWSIPQTLLAYLAGGGDPEALKALHQGPGDGDHKHTDDVDFYWSFTLKGQARKYFLLKDELDKGYAGRYFSGGKKWTAADVKPNMELVLALDSPDEKVRVLALETLEQMRSNLTADLAEKATNPEAKEAILEYTRSPMAKQDFGDDREKWRTWYKFFSDRGWKVFEEVERLINPRPHPKYGVGAGPVGGAWDPKVRGFWADARNTDNLRGMREVAAYLFAEETGNESTRLLYKEKIRRTAYGFLGMGMGEWDSTSYHMHSFAAYLNLYDFAKDEQVVGYAKAILDYLSACGGVKYFHGAWGGPVKRDYGTSAAWDTTSAGFWPYFGGAPAKLAHSDLEHAFIFTSSYRPPMAIVKMAEKQGKDTYELLNSHPDYENWLPGKGDKPSFHETMFVASTFQMGTLSRGSDGYDTAGFKIATRSDRGDADLVMVGSAKGKIRRNNAVTTVGGDQIGQYRNKAILLNAKTDAEFVVILPAAMKQEKVGDGVIVHADKSWIALLPINARHNAGTKVKPKPIKGGGPKLTAISFSGGGGDVAGLAVIVGDATTHGSVTGFKKAASDAKLKVDGKKATLAAGGESLVVEHAVGNPKVWRNGKLHDWDQHTAVYSSVSDDKAPIHLGWKQYKLHVAYDGYRFTGELTKDGKYISKNEGPGL